MKDGRFAATTNFRESGAERGERSRGELPLRLARAGNVEQELSEIVKESPLFGGFHVVVGDAHHLYHMSNRGEAIIKLEPGFHGISNGPRHQPWPKTRTGLAGLAAALGEDEPDVEAIFRVLSDQSVPPDDLLPDTGWGIAWERTLGSVRIDAGRYGTRVSTVLLMGATSRMVEFDWDQGDRVVVEL